MGLGRDFKFPARRLRSEVLSHVGSSPHASRRSSSRALGEEVPSLRPRPTRTVGSSSNITVLISFFRNCSSLCLVLYRKRPKGGGNGPFRGDILRVGDVLGQRESRNCVPRGLQALEDRRLGNENEGLKVAC